VNDNEQVLYQPPVLDIGGVERQFKRPNIFQVIALGEIVAKCANIFTPDEWIEMGEKITPSDGPVDIGEGMKFIVQVLPVVGEELVLYLGSLVGMSEKEVRDSTKFPLGSELKVANALLNCPDVATFFTEVKTLVKHPGLKKLFPKTSLPDKSTSSKSKQDGATKK